MLQNPIYRGLISDKGAIYSGQHAPIIDQDLWDQVQQALAQNRDERVSKRAKGSERVSLLTGMVFDAAGARLTPTHSATRKRRYRYYTSRSLITGTVGTSGPAYRIPAQDLEQIVIDKLRHFLTDNVALHQVIHPILPKADDQHQALTRAHQLVAASWDRDRLRALDLSVTMHPEHIDIRIDPLRLIRQLIDKPGALETDIIHAPIILSAPVSLRRAGLEMRMVIGDGIETSAPDPNLIRIVQRAMNWRDKLTLSGSSITALAAAEGVGASYVTRLLKLSYLAPSIVTDILDGRQPIGLTANKLTQMQHLPLCWHQQRQQLGFRALR